MKGGDTQRCVGSSAMEDFNPEICFIRKATMAEAGAFALKIDSTSSRWALTIDWKFESLLIARAIPSAFSALAGSSESEPSLELVLVIIFTMRAVDIPGK